MRTPLLFLHICSGTIGCLSGFIAVFLRKGSRGHGILGNVFFGSMLTLGGSGAVLAIMKSQPTNVLAGALTCYLVATAWVTARRRAGIPGLWDFGALLVILTVGLTELTFGTQAVLSPTGMKYDYPPAPYFIFGAIALLAGLGDIRVFLRRGISGTSLVARHLWRMCFALFIASASIFLARPQLFPPILKKTGVLAVLTFLPLLLMIFWLIRVRFAKTYTATSSRPPLKTLHLGQERNYGKV